MRCSICGHANASDARFCAHCGTALPRTCPVCEHGIEPDARFCSRCGTSLADEPTSQPEHDLSRYVPETLLSKIRAARAGGAMRGERRTVTMLFADIEGSTAAAEQLDPEEWADIVNVAFEHLITPVYRYEGTLARLQGDAVLAFFGAPIAHEDDPIRAVHAALEMIASIRTYAADVLGRTGVPIAVRVGINTGLVVVGEVGSDLRVEYTALGDAINVAARMEQTAEPGTVRTTEHTAGLLADAFVLTEIGPVEVKGRADPVLAVRVGGVAAAAAAGEVTPVVGRDRERDELRGVVERVVAGIGGVATVVGEAGIGKSRLLAAMRQDAESTYPVATTNEAAGEVVWLEGRCRSFDTGVPYAPFLDLATRWLDVLDLGDDAAFDQIDAAVTRARGEPDADMTTFLGQIAGTPLPPDRAALVASMDAPALHEKTSDAIVSYLEAEATRRPLIIVLDDLHWADGLSLALAERLMSSAERAPIALVLSLRPVREEPSWRLVETASREAAHRHTPIELDPLREDAADALLDLLLGGHDMVAEERGRILRRAEGNPLFVEELVRSISDHEGGQVPTSLSGLLSARLDRLGEDSRLLAEVAAVVGREFESDALAALVADVDVDATLVGLVRQGVLTERRRRPRPLFAFRHALIQETAYNTILLKDRRALHGRLARHLEETQRDAPHEIARHHLASDTPGAAFPWLVEAGLRANRAMALAESIRLFNTALEHRPADATPDEVARLHTGLGEAYSLVPDLDQASAAYQSRGARGRATEQPSLEVQALNRLGINAALIGADFIAAGDYLGRARAVAEEAGDELGLAEYHMNACFVAVAEGELERAIEHDTATARLGEASGVSHVRVTGLARRAMNLIAATRFEEAGEALDEARRAAEEAGSEELLALMVAHGEASLLQRDGELATSLELLAAASHTLERLGSFFAPMVHADASRVALWLGDLESALSSLGAALRTAERRGQPFATSGASATLALCYAICGDAETSARHRARALEALALPVGDYLASTVWADLGFASIEQGAWSDAEADFAVGLETSSSTRFWERPRLLAGAARVALERGDRRRARQLLDDAIGYADERGMRLFRPLHRYGAALISRADGDPAEAADELAAADAEAERMGTRLLAVDIAAARAGLAEAQGRSDEAAAQRERRQRMVDAIVGDVAHPDLRTRLAGRLRWTATSPQEQLD